MFDASCGLASGTRIASGIAASVGLLTTFLACVGLFGVVSYGVGLRTKEIGIHLALGASQRSILRRVTKHALHPLVFGMVAGTAAAVPIAVALTQSPLQLAAADPLSYTAALVLLGVAATSAALIPAVRGLASDPRRALRHE